MKKKQQKMLQRSSLTAAILAAMGSAHGATINVDGGCTLVDAIQAANTDAVVGGCTAGSDDDVIQFVTPDSQITISTIFAASSYGPGSSGLPAITSNVTIEGNGAQIVANNNADAFRLFEVHPGGDLTLRDTQVSNADDGYGLGSGLFSYAGRVTIENSTFNANNGAISLIYNLGSEINNSVIRHNSQSQGNAAGLSTYFSRVDINNSSIIDNQHLSIDYIRGSGAIAGGAGLVQSEVTITNSTISGNESLYGAGIFITDDNPLPLPSKFSRFGKNHAMRGTINSEITITNSTITNNKAYLGAGIVEAGNVTTLTVQGSIVAGNTVYNNGYYSEFFSSGNSVINTDANNIIGHLGDPGIYNVPIGPSDSTFSNDAKDNLYPLTVANGQLMHPLKVGSIAIDGNDLSCFGSIVDQEGKGRGKDGDDNGSFICDIGSFEHTLPIVVMGTCDFSSALLSAHNDGSINGCEPGKGHDIIMLPENSTQTFTTVADTVVEPILYSPYNTFGIPRILSSVTIEANGSTIERDTASSESFDLFFIHNGGHLNLIDAHVTGTNGGLGAITTFPGGNVNVLDSTISGNNSVAIFDVYSYNSSVVNTTIDQNTFNTYGIGSAISPLTTLVSEGFELRQSTISNNQGYTGGGVDFRTVNMATMDNTTISGNSGIYGSMILTPGQYSYGSNKMATIRNATITGNIGSNAGGIYSISPYDPGKLRMSHSVVSGNVLAPPVPRGNANRGSAHAMLALPARNTIAGGGPVPTEIFSTTPYLMLDANNIIGQNGDAGTVTAVLGPSDTVPVGATSTVIEPLADNGGDTLTHMPVDGGIAVDGGDIFCGLNEDQLGRIRPWDGDGDNDDRCDVGSVERGSVAASDIIFKDGFDDAIIILKRKRVSD